MALFLPSTTPEPDRYYKYVDNDELEKLKRLLNRDDIHIFRRMHMKIAYVQFFGVLMLIYVGAVLGQFWHSKYFSFGPPVVTRDVNVDVPWKYWLLLSVLAWDRIFAKASSYVIGNWRINVVLNKQKRPMPSEYYSKTMFILITDHIANLLRYAIMLVFVYSQVDFALAYAVPDVLIDTFSAFWSAKRLTQKYRELDKVLCARDDPTPVSPDAKLPKNVSGWNISPFMLTWLQWMEVLLFVLVFYFTGYFDSPYFQLGAPFPLFNKLYKSNTKYALFVVFVFIDQILSSLHTAIVGSYVLSNVLNNSNPDLIYPKNGVRYIYNSRKVFGWIRIIFLLFFILSEFSFLIAMIIGDLLVTFFMLNRILSHRYLKPNSGQRPNWLARMAVSELHITNAVLIELVIVIIVALAKIEIYKLPYFNWPPPLFIFDTLVTSGAVAGFIIFYSVLDRIIYASTTEITYPYIANVITGCDPDGMRYDLPELVFIVFMNSATDWIRRIVGFNFLLSNFALVLFQALADIVTSAVILEHYLAFKDRIAQARATLQYRLDDAAATKQVTTQPTGEHYPPSRKQTQKTQKPIEEREITYDNTNYYENYFELSNKLGD